MAPGEGGRGTEGEVVGVGGGGGGWEEDEAMLGEVEIDVSRYL